MKTTTHETILQLMDVMVARGVKHAVVSPGSRNAPLLIALAADDRIEKRVIVDERSAGYVAVGIAQQSGAPVALVCTSGTALLNYAPAVAEAYYQQLPLIVISADRPTHWIDQNDSQTIRQHGALQAVVKRSYDVQSQMADDTARWSTNRMLNEAVAEAVTGRNAPVHINVHCDEPLYEMAEASSRNTRIIEVVQGASYLTEVQLKEVSQKIAATKKVMIFAAMSRPDAILNKALAKLAAMPNVVVASETIANVSCQASDSHVYRTLLAMTDADWQELEPQLIIWFGGAPIMREMKTLMRRSGAEQWRVGQDDCVIDTMQHLAKQFVMPPADFFSQVAEALIADRASDYNAKWKEMQNKANQRHANLVKSAPWSDFKAMSVIMPRITADYNLQLSNGTSIRYAQLFDTNAARQDCNRGTSGIDGSTSTALGASLVGQNRTLLITGDVSFGYDLAGLASECGSEPFKIIVLANGGGEIFRVMNGPQSAGKDTFERYFETKTEVPVEKYARAFGFDYFQAQSEAELSEALENFFAAPAPAILAVKAPCEASAQAYGCYTNRS